MNSFKNFILIFIILISYQMKPESMKLYCMYTSSYKVLFEKYFYPSIKDDVMVIAKKIEGKGCEYGTNEFKEILIKKVEFIIEAIKENEGNLFIYSDVDIIFFQPVVDILKNLIEDNDFIIQKEGRNILFSTGFIAIKANNHTLKLWQDAKELMLNDATILTDRDALIKLIQEGKANYIKYKVLPIEFYNGGLLTEQQWLPGNFLPIPENIILHHASWSIGARNKISQLQYVQVKNKIKEKFKLITVLYNEQSSERMNEYIACLEKNLQNKYIDEIHVIYDMNKDDSENKLLKYLESKPIKISYFNERPTFSDLFNIANIYYPNSKIIVSNADIYYNETLQFLENYNFENKFLAITRWDVQKDGSLKVFEYDYERYFNSKIHIDSQDTWIFKTPLKKFKDDLAIGTMGCDSMLMYYAIKSGLNVINPCLSIQCCHLHLSDIRNYNILDENPLPEDYQPVEASKINFLKIRRLLTIN